MDQQEHDTKIAQTLSPLKFKFKVRIICILDAIFIPIFLIYHFYASNKKVKNQSDSR